MSCILNKSPLFTVVVPVYNTEKYIERCVESILTQDYTNFELILVDDGSVDTSGLICDKYAQKDSRVKVIHKTNGGIASVRNIGISEAKGEWITFCDSDDFVYQGWLKTFADNCSDVDIVCQGIRFDESLIGENNSKYKDVSFSYDGETLDYVMATYKNNIVGYTTIKCFKRELLKREKLHFKQSYVPREDEEFVLRYMNFCKKTKAVSYIGYHYFVPDFKCKYDTFKDNLDLCNILLVNALNLYKNLINDHTREYLNFYTGILARTYYKYTSISILKKYRDTVGALVFETGLPNIIKGIIYYDVSFIISSFTMYIYSIYLLIKSNQIIK